MPLDPLALSDGSEIDSRHKARVRAGFADQGLIHKRRDRQVFVTADDDVDFREHLRHPAVVRELEMRQHHDGLRAFRFDHRDKLPHRLERIADRDALAFVAADLIPGEADADESHLEPIVFAHEMRCRAADRLPGRVVDDVRDHPLPARLLHPFAQHVRPEIELVIAKRGDIEAGDIQRLDHLSALEDGRSDGRRKEVAGEQQQHRLPGRRDLLL